MIDPGWCSFCSKYYNETNSCKPMKVIFSRGKAKLTIPYPYYYRDNLDRCLDCGVIHGGYHHPGCEQELCPGCYEQIISCGCFGSAYPTWKYVESSTENNTGKIQAEQTLRSRAIAEYEKEKIVEKELRSIRIAEQTDIQIGMISRILEISNQSIHWLEVKDYDTTDEKISLQRRYRIDDDIILLAVSSQIRVISLCPKCRKERIGDNSIESLGDLGFVLVSDEVSWLPHSCKGE